MTIPACVRARTRACIYELVCVLRGVMGEGSGCEVGVENWFVYVCVLL